jgi:hypothetical protein
MPTLRHRRTTVMAGAGPPSTPLFPRVKAVDADLRRHDARGQPIGQYRRGLVLYQPPLMLTHEVWVNGSLDESRFARRRPPTRRAIPAVRKAVRVSPSDGWYNSSPGCRKSRHPGPNLYHLFRCSRKSETGPTNGCRNCPAMPPGTGLIVPYFTGQRSAGRCHVPNSRSNNGVCAV